MKPHPLWDGDEPVCDSTEENRHVRNTDDVRTFSIIITIGDPKAGMGKLWSGGHMGPFELLIRPTN